MDGFRTEQPPIVGMILTAPAVVGIRLIPVFDGDQKPAMLKFVGRGVMSGGYMNGQTTQVQAHTGSQLRWQLGVVYILYMKSKSFGW